jgi:hypothetical protein
MRCGSRELRHRQGRGGKQHDAKVCHDVLGPSKKVLGNDGLVLPNDPAGRSTANRWAGLWRVMKLGGDIFHPRNRVHASLFIAHSGRNLQVRLMHYYDQ